LEFEADWAVFDWLGCCAVLPVLEFGVCCAWLLAGGGLLVWAWEGVDDPPGCVEPEGVVVCACEELLEGAVLEGVVCACDEPLEGAVFEGEVPEGEVCACVDVLDEAGADWLVVVVVEFAEPEGWFCAEEGVEDEGVEDEDDEPGLEGLVWVWADDGGFAVVLLGDWAKAAVARIRPRAVLANSCLFIRDSFRSRRWGLK
jgi:hypothetical protein